MVIGLTLSMIGVCTAQEDQVTDTTPAIYDKIEEFSKKGKVWRWIHSAIFVPADPQRPPAAPNVPPRRVNPYARYKDKVVRKIIIHTLDPFGYTVEDTIQHPTNGLQRIGNRLHRTTRPVIVRNLLLVKNFDRLDPLKVTESERVLRASPAVNDARITVVPAGVGRDSVDLVVRVLDRWTLDAGADGDLSRVNLRATERNLLGLGQELEQRATIRFNERLFEWGGHHRVYNISNSYISSFINYELTELRDVIGINLNRPFYSPLARWAGGFAASKTWLRIPDARLREEEPPVYERLEPRNVDLWLAHGIPLEKDDEESGRLSSLVAGARFMATRHDARLSPVLDPFGAFRDETVFLVGVGLSQRQYYKERYLFRFGLTEDVPEGLLVRFTAGVRKREGLANMPYLGAEWARGRNYDGFGYFGYELGYGTFFDRRGIFDGTLRSGISYFTDLISFGRWHLRQFVRAGMVMGFRKPDFSRLHLNVEQMYGFQSHQLYGTHRAILNLETVAYAPWDLIGFRIAPVFLLGFGMLTEEQEPLLSGRVHSSFTLGILVRNERLLMNTFEVALSFYPYVPEENGALWRHNAFTNFNTGLRGFDFTQPTLIGYH